MGEGRFRIHGGYIKEWLGFPPDAEILDVIVVARHKDIPDSDAGFVHCEPKFEKDSNGDPFMTDWGFGSK